MVYGLPRKIERQTSPSMHPTQVPRDLLPQGPSLLLTNFQNRRNPQFLSLATQPKHLAWSGLWFRVKELGLQVSELSFKGAGFRVWSSKVGV
jgi:hypothetical protein